MIILPKNGGIIVMLYNVNYKIIKMLEELKWAPYDQDSLAELITESDNFHLMNTYFQMLQSLAEEVKDLNLLDKDELIDVERALLNFYSTLAQYSTKQNRVEEICNFLEKHLDFYREDKNNNFHLPTVIKLLHSSFCLFSKTKINIKLKENMNTNEITRLYKAWISSYSALFYFHKYVEKTLTNFYGENWKDNVFDLNKLDGLNCVQEIKGPSDVIVSFCEDISKYYTTSQQVISASLHNTKSRNTYHGRSFGFMYSFSPDTLIAMNPHDTESAVIPIEDLAESLKLITRGVPVQDEKHYYCVSPLGLRPIYNFDKFKNETYKYNEILLEAGTVPFGMFIFREALNTHGLSVMACCINHDLPLFICDKNGNMKYIPVNEIHNRLDIINSEVLKNI